MAEKDDIRRKIALYREYLAEGVDGERAMIYLREIKRLEMELEAIEGESTGDKHE